MKNGLQILCVVGLVLTGWVHAQDPLSNVPDTAREEVTRRGDMVVRAGSIEANQDDVTYEIRSALAPPPDDSHKWFITVISSENCAPCKKMMAEWETSPKLLAWAKPSKPTEGWAFFHFYKAEDQTQSWRWKNIKIQGYPTILIQPPRNGEWGKPATVVGQFTGYTSADDLAKRMTAAVQAYVAKVHRQDPIMPRNELPALVQAGHGQAPPFDVPQPSPNPSIDPIPARPLWPFPVQPQPQPQPATWPFQPAQPSGFDLTSLILRGLFALMGGQGIANVLLLVLIGVQLWRSFRKATGQPLLLDDAAFQKLIDGLKSAINPANPADPK